MAEQEQRPTPAEIAARATRSKLEGRGFKITLPVKADWPEPLFPIDRDPAAGVDPGDKEVHEGEQAIALRTLQEVEFAGYSLGELMRDSIERFGTKQRVAEELVAMEPKTTPESQELAPGKGQNTRDVAAMLRKVQEWTQGEHKVKINGEWEKLPGPKYAKPSGINKRRVVRLMALFTINLTLGVGGWWKITEKDDQPTIRYMEWHTPGRADRHGGHTRVQRNQSQSWIAAARHVILDGGDGFVELVIESAREQFAPYPVELESVHALYVEMSW